MLNSKKEEILKEEKAEVKVAEVKEAVASKKMVVDTKEFVHLNIRREPNYGAVIIGYLKDGQEVEVGEMRGSFIQLVNQEGWVHADFLK